MWKNLSVSHKLFAVVGVMALLIAAELFTLLFAMNTLSAVRAFVHGEGNWSKAQKGAVLELQNYARTYDERHYEAFRKHLKVPLGDHKALMELQKPVMDMQKLTEGFIQGDVHPHDIQPMVELIRRFHEISYINRAIRIWVTADGLIAQLIDVSDRVHSTILSRNENIFTFQNEVETLMDRVFVINNQLTELENQFSSTLGEASRWLEYWLMVLLVIAVATVECTGLLFTITFSRSLTRALNELHTFASDVGKGDFSKTVPVRSTDELGRLAMALNKMAADLKEVSGERQVAERANRIKNLFLANMSHEIRTPLNAILGFVELLKESSMPETERLKYLQIIERTGNGLATIINDILDISKVEAGKLEIEKQPCSPKQVIKDLESLLSLRCEEKGINLQISCDHLPEWILTDGTRFKQILLNVVGNAIKFTSHGEVRVVFEVKHPHLICTVSDTGVGISKENVANLFQPFSQLDHSIRKQFGGTGLGLILSKRLAQLLGGDVTLKNTELGRGSTFVASITLTELQPRPAPPPIDVSKLKVSRPLNGMRVLIVEDSLDNQLLAEQFLTRAGAEVTMVKHGMEAIDAVLKENFTVILMDMQMPVMDGYTATAQLRQMGYQVPIVALTAHAMKEDLQKCLKAGCDDYLCKPFHRSNLISMVMRHCHNAHQEVVHAA